MVLSVGPLASSCSVTACARAHACICFSGMCARDSGMFGLQYVLEIFSMIE